MSDHHRRLARQIAATLGAVGVAISVVATKASAVSTVPPKLTAGVIVGDLKAPAAITGIGATMPVWDAHHATDVHCGKPSDPKYACPVGYDRNPSLPDQICDHDEFCSVEVPDLAADIVWDYSMQFPGRTDLARAKQLVLTQVPHDARIAWYQPLPDHGACSEMGLTSRTLAHALPIKGEGGVLVILWWDYVGKGNPYLPPFTTYVDGASLKLWGSHATPQPNCAAGVGGG